MPVPVALHSILSARGVVVPMADFDNISSIFDKQSRLTGGALCRTVRPTQTWSAWFPEPLMRFSRTRQSAIVRGLMLALSRDRRGTWT